MRTTVAGAPAGSRPAGRRVRERGMASWVTIVLVLGIAAAAYAAVVFVPPAVLHYEAKQVVRDYGNQSVKNPDDEALVTGMLQKLRTLQTEEVVDASGRKVRVPIIELSRQDVTWERNRDANTLHVAFEYPRTLDLPWLDRSIERVYRVDLTMDISRPDWGPSR